MLQGVAGPRGTDSGGRKSRIVAHTPRLGKGRIRAELNKQRIFVTIAPTARIPPQDNQGTIMLNIAQIQEQILSLSEANLHQLRRWFYDQDWENWDRQIEADSDTGKLDFLVADAFEMAGGRGFEPLLAESEESVPSL